MTQHGPFVSPPVPPRPAQRPRRAVPVVIAVLAALVVILGGTAAFLLWRAQTAEASTATLEATNSATADSFMPAQGPDASVPSSPARGGGTVAGSTPGLFGGTRSETSCDQDQMSRFLQTHPDKATVWAEAEGIRAGDIPAYVHQLTPVLLRADAYVTNHGYRDGELTSYAAVLQAGTAVLVDGYGTPRVKCYCGNPVSAPPRHQPAHFAGRPWRGFAPVTVIVIRPAPVVIENLTIIDVENDTRYDVVLPVWRWGPPPGWSSTDPRGTDENPKSADGTPSGPTEPGSTGPGGADPDATGPGSADPGGSDQDDQGPVDSGTDCEPVAGGLLEPGTATTPTCDSTPSTPPTSTVPTTTTTPTSPTTTSTTTDSTTTTTTTSELTS